MKAQTLSANHIWQRPVDLLIMFWNPKSSLQREIDWYLNFAVSKAFHHHSQELSSHQHELLSEVGLQPVTLPKKSDDVLCMAPAHFFSRYVAAWAARNVDELTSHLNQVSDWLKASRVTVLLPTSVSVEDFEASLQKLGFDKEIFVAMDVNSPNE